MDLYGYRVAEVRETDVEAGRTENRISRSVSPRAFYPPLLSQKSAM